MDVRSDIKAASITASIKPRRPEKKYKAVICDLTNLNLILFNISSLDIECNFLANHRDRSFYIKELFSASIKPFELAPFASVCMMVMN